MSLTRITQNLTLGNVKNYISNADFEIGSAANWSLFNTTLTSGLPSGTVLSGASSLNALVVTSTNQIAGSYSMQLSSAGVVTAGQGFISNPFIIDRGDQAKILTAKYLFEVIAGAANLNLSGILGSQTVAAYIYDVTNSAWVQPTGFLGMNQSSGPGVASPITFQTASVGNGNTYRLAIVFLQASAGAVTINFDSFSVSPQTIAVGAAVTDWTTNRTFTPVNFGTVTNANWQTRRVGDSLEVIGYFTGGTAAAATASFTLPSGLSIDSNKLSNGAGGTIVGMYNADTSATFAISTSQYQAYVFYDGSTVGSLFIAFGTTSNALNKNNGNALMPTNGNATLGFTVPILGWSSNVQMSSDTDTRVISTSVGLNTAQAIAANGIVKYDTIVKDTAGSYSTTTGLLTVSVPGSYQISAAASANLSGYQYVKVNGVSKGYILLCPAASQLFSGSITLPLNAGDAVGIYSDAAYTLNGTATNGFVTYAAFTRISGPATIAASESVNASYWASASSTISPTQPCNFDSKEFDSHGAVTTGAAWRYTAPVSGTYQVSGTIYIGVNAVEFSVYKNGTQYKHLMYYGQVATGNSGQFSTLIRLNAGEYFDVRPITAQTLSGGTLSASTGNTPSNISILRVGN